MKKLILLASVLAVIMSSCSLYDLRPEALKESGIDDINKAKAIELISASAKVHGWDSIDDARLSFIYSDEWPGFIFNTFFRPWPASSIKMKHSFDTKNLFTSSIELLDGKKKGEIWGLEDKKAYKIINGNKVFKQSNDISFYLPAYQYFLEIGIWAADIPEVVFVGEQKIANKTYQVVFGTWNTLAPQKEVDQYLFYFEKQTKRLAIIEYTIRDVMGSAHGVNWLSDFREQDGLLIPFKQTITGDLDDDKIVHEISISSFSID